MLKVRLNDTALAMLYGWCGLRKCDYVFYNLETGERWKDLLFGLKKACRKACVNDVAWHTFRHTFASRLTRIGFDLVTAKELAWPFVGVCDDALTPTAMQKSA